MRRKTWRWSWCASSWRRARLRAGFARAFSFSNHSLMSSPCSGKYPFPKGLHLDLSVCRLSEVCLALSPPTPLRTHRCTSRRGHRILVLVGDEFPCFNKTIKRLENKFIAVASRLGHHRLGNVFRVCSDAGAETATKKHNLHSGTREELRAIRRRELMVLLMPMTFVGKPLERKLRVSRYIMRYRYGLWYPHLAPRPRSKIEATLRVPSVLSVESTGLTRGWGGSWNSELHENLAP